MRFGTLILLWVAVVLAAMTAHTALAEDAARAQPAFVQVQLHTAYEDVLNILR
jgi:hypothetical protein